mgnify:FL=1
MITPHGSENLNPLIVESSEEKESLIKASESMEKVVVSSAAAGNLVMLGAGYFNPLTGFMNKDDVLGVANNMKTSNGLFWPTPVMNLVKDEANFQPGQKVALLDPNCDNALIAIQTVEKVEILSDDELDNVIQQTFGTKDKEHPGVQTLYGQGNILISGDVKVLNYSYFDKDFPSTFITAVQIRE